MSSRKKAEGQVTLNEMLKVLDKDVANVLEKKLKRLSKKKAIKAPLDEHKAAQIERKVAYTAVQDEVSQWDPIIQRNRSAKQLNFPLDQQPDVLPTTAESLSHFEPRNDFEASIQNVIHDSETALHDKQELTVAEQKYLKAISAEESKERHLELQRMRVLLSSYAAKMRRQKSIKSKSYHRLLKKERIKNHMKKVESDGDALMNEIERLQRLRAQERASLKHKNTGKWAKHAKFRAKYDDEARRAMLDQIGIASKLLERPITNPSSDDDDEDEDLSDVSVETDEDEDDMDTTSSRPIENNPDKTDDPGKKQSYNSDIGGSDRLIISSELISNRTAKRKTRTSNDDDDDDDDDDEGDSDMDEDGDDENERQQRELMSEAFANDDVVKQFRKAKKSVIDEEQPKDTDTFLPGWGDWAGPGIKISKKKRKRHIIKAPKVQRKDETLGNVIISEKANDEIKELQLKNLPRGIRDEKHLEKILTKPVSATFTTPALHREMVKPRVKTLMGSKIEPISKRVLRKKAGWA